MLLITHINGISTYVNKFAFKIEVIMINFDKICFLLIATAILQLLGLFLR